MKKLLIVNTLSQDNPDALNVLGYFQNENFELEIINTNDKNYSHCIGCNACWLVTPGVCSIKDGYDELIKAYLRNDAVVFICNTALNFVDYKMKNIIDRLLPLATMGIKIKDNQCRHIPRYDKCYRFAILYCGRADKEYMNRWLDRVMLNFDGESLGAYSVKDVKELIKCI